VCRRPAAEPRTSLAVATRPRARERAGRGARVAEPGLDVADERPVLRDERGLARGERGGAFGHRARLLEIAGREIHACELVPQQRIVRRELEAALDLRAREGEVAAARREIGLRQELAD